MAKIRYTKNELKLQKEALKRFLRYLPTLELKKTQLVNEIRSITHQRTEVQREIDRFLNELDEWVAVFGEEIDLSEFISLKEIVTRPGNIAGIEIEVYEEVLFEERTVDYFLTPIWVDAGIEACRHHIKQKAHKKILERQLEVLREELRITTQRINLFEKVKIPEARENIRVINIYLGDMRTTEVVRGKISKAKIERKRGEAAA